MLKGGQHSDIILWTNIPCPIYLANNACLSYVDRAPPARRQRDLCPSEASRKFYDYFCGLSKEAIFPVVISISAGATLLPDSCVQVQLRAFEQLPIYTFEGPQQQGRPKSKAPLSSLKSLKLCVCVCERVGDLAPVRSGRSSLRSRNRSEQPGSFRHGAGGLPRRRGGTSRRNVSSTASANIYYPCRCFCQAFGI